MAGFKYEAVDAAGRTQRGVMEFDTARQVRGQLREQGLLPVSVEAIEAPSGSAHKTTLRWRRGLRAAELSLVTRQLATLLEAGLTVEQTLNAVIEQSEAAAVREILAGVRSEVLAGQSLGRAMRAYPHAFPEIYTTLVSAGEHSGNLATVLLRLAEYSEERHALQTKVALAFIYPAIVSLVALAVVIGLLTYVVPQVVGVFENSNQTLPWLTRALMGLSAFMRASAVFWLIAIAAAVWGVRRALRIPYWRERFDRRLLKLPLIGRLVRGINTARVASTLAILVGGGVPLLNALQAAVGVLSNLPMKNALDDAARRVREGTTLSRALAESGLYPPMMVHLIASGEASGRLDTMLERVARQQTQELQTRVSVLTAILEPALILLMGLFVLLIVLAILLPIFEMNQLVR